MKTNTRLGWFIVWIVLPAIVALFGLWITGGHRFPTWQEQLRQQSIEQKKAEGIR